MRSIPSAATVTGQWADMPQVAAATATAEGEGGRRPLAEIDNRFSDGFASKLGLHSFDNKNDH